MERILTPCEVSEKQIVVNSYELRKDLRVFVKYIQDRRVKRSYRENRLSKTDTKRLAKSMTCGFDTSLLDQFGDLFWVDFIDELALNMGFVKYDTEGSYAGYSSAEPSYPDNYIQFKSEQYKHFLDMDLSGQEQLILNTLSKKYSYQKNEFLSTNALSQLDRFDYSGCARGALPLLNFDKARSYILKILEKCKPGVWYTTESLVQWIKKTDPFFLIPEQFPIEEPPEKIGRYQIKRSPEHIERYGNFRESKRNSYSREIQITDKDPDGFERVEGRYIERFLEGIPLLMNYVDCAYEDQERILFPSRGKLYSFRVNERLHWAIQGNLPKPKVTVQPNLEIHVESLFYPASLIDRLESLADIITEDRVTILMLRREKILVALTEDHKLDVVELLTGMVDRPLPQNVITEIKEWSGQSDTFTLFKGFGLLEVNGKVPESDWYSVEQVAPGLSVIKEPLNLFNRLETKELLPFLVQHTDNSLKTLPKGISSVFAKKSQSNQVRSKPKVSLKWESFVTLHCPDVKLLDHFKEQLLGVGVVFKVDTLRGSVTFPKIHEPLIRKTIQTLKKTYQIQIQE